MASQLFLYLAHVIPFATLWILSVFEVIPTFSYLPDFTHHFVLFAPIYTVLLLGFYAIFSVIHGVSTFNDCNDAKQELVQEIKEAREDLKKRKIID
ncbi:unnamed protein product [Caenorhabditis angaria]|uniref:Dolichol-phosphate mannosyltransferase subunit 3 n=1 Tax=Caenorhabditis angaria TaxID=860376 RepID=A0A9P1IPM8_9PELO|nr:unnamed protein product [Caenorhabditis angaria]